METSAREAAFQAIKQLAKHIADAVRNIKPETTDVNVYAARLEPGWLERAPFAKVAVEHKLLHAVEELESVPLTLRLMDAIGIDPSTNCRELSPVLMESVRGYTYNLAGGDPGAELTLFAARRSLLALTFSMGTRVLVSASDAGAMLYPGWRISGGYSPIHRAAGPKLMGAIEAYVTPDEARWSQAQTQAEAGLLIVSSLSSEQQRDGG
jgi:hypothetical protein